VIPGTSLVVLAAGLQALQTMIRSIERRIIAQHRSDEASKRLTSIPGIGVVGATAIAATVPDPKVFRSGRDFAAWIGIVPREDSTGGKHKLGPISKRGDQYLRRILVVGAHAVLKRARHQPEKYPWVTRLPMIRSIERRIIAQHRSDEASKRLTSIPGIGVVGATAIAATCRHVWSKTWRRCTTRGTGHDLQC
jgi:transposase